VADIIKTWPAFTAVRTVAEMFFDEKPCWCRYYFSLGRGKPQQPVEHIWFTWRGRILGSFEVEEIVCNVGQLPKLYSLSGKESEWQIRKDAWVAICASRCSRLRERIYMNGFRGWRYFDLEFYRYTVDAKFRI